jgi:hypothetical protein
MIRFTRTLRGFALAATLLLIGSSIGWAHGPRPGHYSSLAGFWVIEGFPEPGSGVPDFVNLATMGKHGEVINVDPIEGTGVGGWKKVSPQQYAVTFTGFIVDGGSTVRYIVSSTVTVSGSHFHGPFRTEVLDLDGNPLFHFEGTVNAERQAVQPF